MTLSVQWIGSPLLGGNFLDRVEVFPELPLVLEEEEVGRGLEIDRPYRIDPCPCPCPSRGRTGTGTGTDAEGEGEVVMGDDSLESENKNE